MKKLFGIVLVVMVFCFFGCESMPDDTPYKDMANQHDFDYFFPSYDFGKSFATLDEAYGYVKSAQFKFASSSGKVKAKGLAAKLSGPQRQSDQPVLVLCSMSLGGKDGYFDLSKETRPLETVCRSAVSSIVTFWVFYGDRQVSIPGYYLQTGYKYTGGNQGQKVYKIGEDTYDADYPIGWGVEKAFSYLKKEID